MRRCDQIQQITHRVYEMLFGEKQVRRSCYGDAAQALKDKGAKDVYVYITHAVLSGQAVERLEKSQIKKLITTDTIDNLKKINKSKKIEIISLAPMISEAMKRIANSTSVSSLFK